MKGRAERLRVQFFCFVGQRVHDMERGSFCFLGSLRVLDSVGGEFSTSLQMFG